MDTTIQSLKNRHYDFDRTMWTELERARKKAIQDLESLKAERNKMTELIRVRKQAQQDATDLLEQQKGSSQALVVCEQDMRSIESQWQSFLAQIPNVSHTS
ncbi:MAG: hypothetical protein ACKN95_02555, partial [Holophagaceae bacterium]